MSTTIKLPIRPKSAFDDLGFNETVDALERRRHSID